MFDAADASDAVATGAMLEANDAQISDTVIKSDFKVTLSYWVCERWLRCEA
jgi:hypothetical protein